MQHFLKALDCVGKKLPFKITYQVWCVKAECWQHCEFYLFADNKKDAEAKGKKYCRDSNGQPIDYHELTAQNA